MRNLQVTIVATKNTRIIEYVEPFDPPNNFRLVADFTIKGKPGRKSNSRRIVRNKKTKVPLIIKSADALAYADDFARQVTDDIRLGVGNDKEILAVWAHMFYPSNRQDVSIEMITDLMQKEGIISQDRWIKSHIVFGAIDREDPRVRIKLYIIGDRHES